MEEDWCVCVVEAVPSSLTSEPAPSFGSGHLPSTSIGILAS